MTVISNKIKAIMKLTTDIDAIISGKPASPGQQPTEEGEAVNEEASAG